MGSFQVFIPALASSVYATETSFQFEDPLYKNVIYTCNIKKVEQLEGDDCLWTISLNIEHNFHDVIVEKVELVDSCDYGEPTSVSAITNGLPPVVLYIDYKMNPFAGRSNSAA
jgi:hypothetical protein